MRPTQIAGTVERLRAAGYRVHVNHYRRARPIAPRTGRVGVPTLNAFPTHRLREWKDAYRVEPKGGVTEVLIEGPDGTGEWKGESVCSERDTWNRKVGVAIALGRAVAQLEGEGKKW